MKKLMLLSATVFLCATPFAVQAEESSLDANGVTESAVTFTDEGGANVDAAAELKAATVDDAQDANATTPAAGDEAAAAQDAAVDAEARIQEMGSDVEAGVPATATTEVDAN